MSNPDPTRRLLRGDYSVEGPEGVVRPGDDGYIDALRAVIETGTVDPIDAERAYQANRFIARPGEMTIEGDR
jgi:hypothetical protein